MNSPYRYKVLVGVHCQDEIDATGKKVTQQVDDGQGGKKTVPIEKVYTPQDGAFWTNTDLSAKFDRENMPPKFQRVYDLVSNPPAEKAAPATQAVQPPPSPPKPDLDTLSLEDLKRIAEDEEVDLKGLKSRDEILKRLKTVLGTK